MTNKRVGAGGSTYNNQPKNGIDRAVIVAAKAAAIAAETAVVTVAAAANDNVCEDDMRDGNGDNDVGVNGRQRWH
jgi:hypothetical protein